MDYEIGVICQTTYGTLVRVDGAVDDEGIVRCRVLLGPGCGLSAYWHVTDLMPTKTPAE